MTAMTGGDPERATTSFDDMIQNRERALRGELLYYEVGYEEREPGEPFPKRAGVSYVFSEEPLDEVDLLVHVPVGSTSFDITLMTPEDIRRKVENENLYASFFDKSGTTAEMVIPFEKGLGTDGR